MDLEALAKFASDDAPESGNPLYRSVNVTFGFGRSNLALLFGIHKKIEDLIYEGDVDVPSIPLTKVHWKAVNRATEFLDLLAHGELHPDFGEETLPPMLEAVDVLRTGYFAPKLVVAEASYKSAKTEWDRLNSYYDYLVQTGTKDPRAIDTLHDEFYADGRWEPDLMEDYRQLPKPQKGILDLERERQLRPLRERFHRAFTIDLTEASISTPMRIWGCPENMNVQGTLMTQRQRDIDVAGKSLHALSVMPQTLKAIMTPRNAEIHVLRPRKTSVKSRARIF